MEFLGVIFMKAILNGVQIAEVAGNSFCIQSICI